MHCPKCGAPLADNAWCCVNCGWNAQEEMKKENEVNRVSQMGSYSEEGFFETIKNQMGIGDPELNKGDAFESGKQIIPDCVKSNESEIPVKQYTVATLRNRILGIPYAKAIGRMQVTNKRVIFRAPGRCLAGRTTVQQEFAIDEIAGIEARREYAFNIWDLILGLIVTCLGGVAILALIRLLCGDALLSGETTGAAILTFIVGIVGCIPFFVLQKKWLLKLLCLGGSFIPLFSVGRTLSTLSEYSYYSEGYASSGGGGFFGGLFTLLAIASFVLALFALIACSIKPNLVLLIKAKAANETIDIRRKKVRPFSDKDEHTGYMEVLPAEDAEKCIREINALINDIQKLGDFGIEKWKA